MFRRGAIALMGAVMLAPLAGGQVRGGMASGRGLPVHASRGIVGGSVAGMHRQRFARERIILGSPFGYSDYEDAGLPQATPPTTLVSAPPVVSAAKAVSLPEPLLIEWNGERFVRLAGSESSPNMQGRDAVQRKPVPVTLIFRDGHRQQVGNYTVADGFVYAHGDYWVDGYWTKKIGLAELNIPATLQVNQERGGKFMLPSGPHEVVIGP